MITTQIVAIVLAICLSGTFCASIQKRDSSDEDTNHSVCHNRTPCAWAVYVPFTRKIEYYMKNTCQCAEGKQCLRSDDDISVSAYVYRCSEGNNRTANSSSEVGNSTTS